MSRPAFPAVPATAACCAVLCLLFALQLLLVASADAHRAHALPARLLPIATIQPGAAFLGDVDANSAMMLQLVSMCETLVLAFLGWLVTVGTIPARALLVTCAVAAAIMATLSLSSRATEGADVYLYAGLARVLPTPYHPAAYVFAGDSSVINRLWGDPLLPSAYGPLWIAISKLATERVNSLYAALIALRAVGLTAYAVCIACLVALRVPRALVALFAVNPAVFDLFIMEAHNDLTGVAFLLAAAVARPRSRFVAIVLCAAGGLVKLPLVLVGMLVFAPEARVRTRIAFAGASAAISLATALVWAGAWYPSALQYVFRISGGTGSTPQLVLHDAIAAIALGTIVFALARDRFFPGSAWLMPAFGNTPLPHYLGWSLPVSFLDPEPNWTFLATIPLVAFLLDTALPMTPLLALLLASLVFGAVIALVLASRRRRIRSESRTG